jgi:hypothetical protein
MATPASPRSNTGKVKPAGPLVIHEGDPAVLKHGILIKQGGSVKSWKKRYFFLYGKSNFRNVVLTYHKKPNEPAIDELPLEGATVELPDPGQVLNFKPKGQTRVYPFKSTSDSTEELLAWYSVMMEHTIKLEDLLFPGTTATVSTMHVFSTLQDRYGAKPGHIRALFLKLGIDYNQPSIGREPLTRLLKFLPPLRKEDAANQGDSPTATLDVLASNRCGNSLSHWTRLMHQPWFYMYKDNLTVYKYLQSKDVGAFVVRFGRFDDVFVLTVKGAFEILHFPVISTPAGFGLPNAASFPSIYAFLRNYVNSPLPSGISLQTFKVVDLEEVSAGNIASSGSSSDIHSGKEKKHKKTDSGATSPGSNPKKSKNNKPAPPAGPPPAGPLPTPVSPRPSFLDAPPALPSVPMDDVDEPPPSLSTPGLMPPPTLNSTVSLATMRLTTAYEVSTSPVASYATPWKIPAGLAKAEGWKTAKHGLCRRILLQKGIKVLKEKEMEQVSHIMRILSPDGPIRILKCYALENSRLVTLFEANNSFLEAKLKTYSTEQPKWAKDDPTGARAETNQVYEHFAARCSWNKDTPLKVVPLIYSAPEDKLQTVEAEGFDKSQEITDGPYGAGCYLTRSIEEARTKTNNGPFIIAFAAPGRVYPTIEPAVQPVDVSSKKGRASVGAAPATLMGKPCKEGYDSHFVRTCGSSKDDPGVGRIFHAGWTASEWDQMVLFSMVQAVPRYLVYLE